MVDQAEKLRNQINMQPNAKTIAVISGKGGVGKSNTVLNFSIELQKQGKKVLLFDLDIGMGNVDILLGKDAEHSIVDLFDDFMPIHDIMETGPKGLSYIAGGSSLNNLIAIDQYKLDYFFKQYELVVKDYDYIFFDMGAGVTETSLSLVLASDECLLITTPEPTAITDAYSMVKQVITKQNNMNISLLVNRCDNLKNGKIVSQRFQEVVTKFLTVDINVLGMLPDDKTVQTAVIRQIPYIILDKQAPISKAMQKVVTAYLHEGIPEIPSEISFIKKLKRFLTVRRSI